MTYRIDLPMTALAFGKNHRVVTTIQAGQVVDLIGPAEDKRFVVVSVNDEQLEIFASDLAARGKQIRGLAVAAGMSGPI